MFRRTFLKILASGSLLPMSVFSKTKKYIYDIRFWTSPDKTRVVLDVSKNTEYTIGQLTNPNRLVVDLKKSSITTKAYKKLKHHSKRIKKIRLGRHKDKIRLVFDNPRKFEVDTFTLPPNSRYKHYRLVFDLKDKQKQVIFKKSKKPIIVIDAGHGGEDPGAIGISGSYEKNIVLVIAKRLANKINKEGKFQARLTRKSDYYISLKQRIKIAQREKASLFISIHADAALRKSARGASIYTLSKRGSNTAFTKHLEATQNASDVFGAEPEIIKKDNFLNNFLINLSRHNRRKENKKLATTLLNEIKKISKIHKKTPQKANFVVLKTPAIPSVLLEVGFISNRQDEINLNNSKYQDKIVRAMFKGIKKYFG